ncbi:MAG: SAM-dependent methyltransferase [Ruminiclostridium sp.]
MNYIRSKNYENFFTGEYLMGPNSVKLMEELTSEMSLKQGMRVLDLGCGTGLTSLFVAREYGVQVYAYDLWVTAGENYKRIKKWGMEDRIIPIHGDANEMPFAEGYFDAVITADSYHYYGNRPGFFREKVAPYLKQGGQFGMIVTGFKREPDEKTHSLFDDILKEEFSEWQTLEWWKKLLRNDGLKISKAWESGGFEEIWADWLNTDNSYAISDGKCFTKSHFDEMNILAVAGNV